MSLLIERIRPNVEAAPWVVDEIIKLQSTITQQAAKIAELEADKARLQEAELFSVLDAADAKKQLSDCQAKLKRYEDAFREPYAWESDNQGDDSFITKERHDALSYSSNGTLKELFTKPEGE